MELWKFALERRWVHPRPEKPSRWYFYQNGCFFRKTFQKTVFSMKKYVVEKFPTGSISNLKDDGELQFMLSICFLYISKRFYTLVWLISRVMETRQNNSSLLQCFIREAVVIAAYALYILWNTSVKFWLHEPLWFSVIWKIPWISMSSQGPFCSVDVNECQIYAGTALGCQNGATCVNTPGSYR